MTIFKFGVAAWILSNVASSMALGLAHAQTAALPPPARPASASAAPPAQTLTAAELAKVKAVLAPYKSASLSADDAKLIKRTLRDAGMRRSPALDAAITAAGFSPARLDQLDPPPPRPAPGQAPLLTPAQKQ